MTALILFFTGIRRERPKPPEPPFVRIFLDCTSVELWQR